MSNRFRTDPNTELSDRRNESVVCQTHIMQNPNQCITTTHVTNSVKMWYECLAKQMRETTGLSCFGTDVVLGETRKTTQRRIKSDFKN